MDVADMIDPPDKRTPYWKSKVERRFNAHKSILTMIRYQGFQLQRSNDPEQNLVFENAQEYAVWAKEVIDPVRKIGYFERDKEGPLSIQLDQSILRIFFLSAGGKDTISKKIISEVLANYIEDGDNEIRFIPNLHLILISEEPLDGIAKNQIISFNGMLEYPIRHFTIDELQYDPTEHALCPTYIVKATPEQIQNFIDRQRGLYLGPGKRLANNYESRYEALETDSERADLINQTNEEILDKLPTINNTDVIVKRYGFRLDDIIIIVRNFGRAEFTYRRVVSMDRVVKPAKLAKQDLTNN